jgi:hypothetical protein
MECIEEIVGEFLRGQMGRGKDETPPNEQEVYTIKLTVDLSFDIFKASSDCGNKGLRDGILMYFLRALSDNPKTVTFKGGEDESGQLHDNAG